MEVLKLTPLGVPLLINAEMNLSSKKFQDHLDKKEVSMTAREYLNDLKDSKNIEEVVQATKVIPFIGSSREIEKAEQTRRPNNFYWNSWLREQLILYLLLSLSLALVG
ncbi:MAG: hypothetical protein LBV62_00660 [Rickettsiales bacterium]|jgi:septin family protein|nr:hypothetical protein [Rickettsiales bacterium]